MSAAHLEALERAGWEALSGDGGVDFYAQVMTDDGLMVFPGMVLDKDTVLATIAQAPPWTRFELTDVRVSLNVDIGVITYHADAQRAGSSPYRALMSSVYVLRGEAWRLVLHQQTPDPQAT